MSTKIAAVMAAAAMLAACQSGPRIPAPTANIETPEKLETFTEPEVNRPNVYVVQGGDTLHNIALNHGLDYRKIAEWNNITDPNRIEVGQQLALAPPPAPGAAATAPTSARARAVSPAQPSAITPVQPAAPAPVPSVQARVQVIRPQAGNAAATAANAPLKTGPVARQYRYSPRILSELRKLEKSGAGAPQASTPAAPVAVAEKPAAATPPPSVNNTAPKKIRRRFGLDWVWPARGKLAGKFNATRKGVDIVGKRGDGVFASADGRVIYVGDGVKSYGRMVILEHGNEYVTAYAHNEDILVREGDRVKRGAPIAKMGDSGAQRVQLHFEIRKGGKPVDPLQFLPASAD